MSGKLLLASQSPRRADILRQLGVDFVQQATEVEELRGEREQAADYVQRLALAKARAGREHYPDLPSLGADTIVLIDNQVLEKPGTFEQALAMWTQLSGRSHWVLSALALADANSEQLALSRTRVRFRVLDEGMMRRYWATGEPADKAGGYGIQGLGCAWVEAIEGSYTGVVGLPVERLIPMLERSRIAYWNNKAES